MQRRESKKYKCFHTKNTGIIVMDIVDVFELEEIGRKYMITHIEEIKDECI